MVLVNILFDHIQKKYFMKLFACKWKTVSKAIFYWFLINTALVRIVGYEILWYIVYNQFYCISFQDAKG